MKERATLSLHNSCSNRTASIEKAIPSCIRIIIKYYHITWFYK